MKKVFWALMTIAVIALTSCEDKNDPGNSGNPDNKGADCIVIGNIITMDDANPTAEAVVVKNGIIQFVGDSITAKQYDTDKIKILRYSKAWVYPGFIEGHVHGLEVANRSTQVDLSQVCNKAKFTTQEFLDVIKQYVDTNQNLELYKGAGWMIVDGMEVPTRHMLDKICDKKPMIFTSIDGHSFWINTAAIEKYGVNKKENIDKYTTAYIPVDEDGYPTGIISEAAGNLVRPALALTQSEYVGALLKWQAMAFSCGVTAAEEAAIPVVNGEPILKAFMELAGNPSWKLRTYASEVLQFPEPHDVLESHLKQIKEHHDNIHLEYFKVYGIKIFMDGVVEAHTAWMQDDYADQPGYKGVSAFPYPERITEAVAFANSNGMNAHFHSIGDAATKTAVEAIIKAQNQTGIKDKRNSIAHLQVVRPDDIRLMGENNIVAVTAPLWTPAFPDYIARERSFIGDRVDTQYPIKSFFEAGACVTFHSDYPVSPNFSIPETFCCAVTRSHIPYKEATKHNTTECVTREQALKAMTVNVAYQLGEENRLGKLKAGYVANMAVFHTNFLTDSFENIFKDQTIATIVDGHVVYGN